MNGIFFTKLGMDISSMNGRVVVTLAIKTVESSDMGRHGRHSMETRDPTQDLMQSDLEPVEVLTSYDRKPFDFSFLLSTRFPSNSAPTASILNQIGPNIPTDQGLPRGDGCFGQFDRLCGKHGKPPVPGKKKTFLYMGNPVECCRPSGIVHLEFG